MRLLLAILLFTSFLSLPQAHAWRAHTTTFVNDSVATAAVYNHWGRVVSCSGSAFGVTIDGKTFSAWASRMIILPGTHAYVQVYSPYYRPFLSAYAQIDCFFL
ncbi:MAG: hypothetical protein HN353_10525 [Bdellovibrionales bacterium]|jgi:hypothetical protein|nr:hypothetical protein [Bdellovibrionales bacterium]MBT3524728.1 hypothetical protein [Bdellovibrionales bacterium]MBT7669198.1 hypothetical protein [Bdellovibrionales bacterium]MBT7767137.1 hypothetical protein [Bdellovibrionales bacterium]